MRGRLHRKMEEDDSNEETKTAMFEVDVHDNEQHVRRLVLWSSRPTADCRSALSDTFLMHETKYDDVKQ